MNYFDCPKCNMRTASPRGCGICGMRATKKHIKAQRKKEAAFESRFKMLPYDGRTLLGYLQHQAAIHPTKKNLRRLAKYEAELRAINVRNASREATRQRILRRVRAHLEEMYPKGEWRRDENGHEYRTHGNEDDGDG